MFLLRRPSPELIRRFLHESQDRPLSYDPIGIVLTAKPGPLFHELSTVIGRGRADFERACRALEAWKQFEIGWTELNPAGSPTTVGTVVAVSIRHLGIWSLNGCRIVYRIGDDGDPNHFGYAYGTLDNHAEAGEEIFEIQMDPATEDVIYRISAVSWARHPLARMGRPIVRVLQALFRRDSAEAMRRLVAAG